MTLEKGIVLGASLGAVGAAILGVACVRILHFISMEGYDPGQLDVASTKLALLGTTLFVTGAQIVFSSFFLGLFTIEPVSTDAESLQEYPRCS